MSEEKDTAAIGHPCSRELTPSVGREIARRRVGKLACSVLPNIHQPNMLSSTLVRGVGHLEQDVFAVRGELRTSERAHMAEIFVCREVELLCASRNGDGHARADASEQRQTAVKISHGDIIRYHREKL